MDDYSNADNNGSMFESILHKIELNFLDDNFMEDPNI